MSKQISRSSEPEPDLLSETSSPTPSAEEINSKVQEAQEQLLSLKRQQEEIERQKRELEDLSRKQREFEEGRREVQEKLTRGLVVLERQEFDIKREAEQIQIVRQNFSEQLVQIEAIDPTAWSSGNLNEELTRSLAKIDQAQALYAQARARLEAMRRLVDEEGGEAEADRENGNDYFTMFKVGFAYSLPGVILLGFLLLIFHIFTH